MLAVPRALQQPAVGTALGPAQPGLLGWGEVREVGRGGQGLGWAGQCPAEGTSSVRERWQHAGEGSQQGLVLQSQGWGREPRAAGAGDTRPLGALAGLGRAGRGPRAFVPSPQPATTCTALMEHPGPGSAPWCAGRGQSLSEEEAESEKGPSAAPWCDRARVGQLTFI